MRHFAQVAAFVSLALAGSALGTTYNWNSSGTNMSSASSWTPTGGPPGGGDIAQFTPTTVPPTTAVTQPTADASNQSLGALTIAPTQAMGNWTFSGTGNTLSFDAATLTTYGPGKYTFSGPTLQGANNGHPMSVNLTTGSTL